MEHHAAAGWPTQVMAAFFMPKGANDEPYDPFAISGADHWYEVGAQKVRALSNDLANATFRPGWLRSVGPGWTNWALESFMDQAAAHVGADPLDFRLSLLTGAGRNAGITPSDKGGALRQAEVLQQVAGKTRAGAAPCPQGRRAASPPASARSAACPPGSPAWPRWRWTADTGAVRVQKLTIVTDAGTIIDPDFGPCPDRRRGPVGPEHGPVRGDGIRGGPGARHQPEHLYAAAHRRRARAGHQLSSTAPRCRSAWASLRPPSSPPLSPTRSSAATGARVTHIPITPEAVLAAIKRL